MDSVKKTYISILALVWRATCVKNTDVSYDAYFNPRPRVEGDHFFNV